MKNQIRKIAAVVSAAVMCAVPVSGSLTADAASSYRMHRTYVISKRTNSAITSLKSVYTRKSGLIGMGEKGGSLGGSFIYWDTTSSSEVNWQPKNNRCDEVGVVLSFTNKTTKATAPKYMGSVKNTYTHKNQSMIDAFDVQNVVVGDVTSEMSGARLTGTYDGLTTLDAQRVQTYINNLSNVTYNGERAIKIETFLRSANYANLDKNTVCGILASDINNNGYVTSKDARAILTVMTGRYDDLTVFNNKTESQMSSMVK